MKKVLIGLLIGIFAIGSISTFWFLKNYGKNFGIYLHEPTACEYALQEIGYMDNGIYATDSAWENAKKDAIEKANQVSSMDEAHQLIEETVKVAGGKHSRLMNVDQAETLESEAMMPSVEMDEQQILYVKLPEIMSSKDKMKEYADSCVSQIKQFQNAKGVIIDLRDNTGGDMGPMLAAVSPFLPEGDLMHFDIRGLKTPVSLTNQMVCGGGTNMKIDGFKYDGCDKMPIAILTNDMTASSAEAVLICFRGLENVKTFGQPTAGYASSNTVYTLYDGAKLLFTIGSDVARTGEVFCEEPIDPDEISGMPRYAASGWILSKDS